MCVSPIKLISGKLVSCHKCWQCRENRIRDWCGRCIAESHTAKAAHSVTLTYGRDESNSPDHMRAAVLTYSDVQKYLKRLRTDGFPCRYLVAGELGSTKGRVHWHLIMYWLKDVPPHKVRTEFYSGHSHWSDHPAHGFTFWDDMNYQSVRYVCKYMQKDIDEEGAQSHFAMSKKPPIGGEYFKQLAAKHVEAGLSPQTPFYQFGDVVDKEGNKIEFRLAGASLDLYCRAFVNLWETRRRGWWPYSEMIEDYRDRMAKRLPENSPAKVIDWEKYLIVQTEPDGNLTWHERERAVTPQIRWQRDHPREPFPGRFERGRKPA